MRYYTGTDFVLNCILGLYAIGIELSDRGKQVVKAEPGALKLKRARNSTGSKVKNGAGIAKSEIGVWRRLTPSGEYEDSGVREGKFKGSEDG